MSPQSDTAGSSSRCAFCLSPYCGTDEAWCVWPWMIPSPYWEKVSWGGTWAWNGSYNVLNPQFGFPVASIDEHQVAELEKAVWKLLKSRLSNEVDSSPHLYLIHNRLEPMPSGPPKKTIMFL